jgi:prepilin-type N-terminal cleavage/methylation domain-containing protein
MNINKKGFTIMELLIVVAIIALITAIVLGSLGTAKQRGTDTGKIRSVAEIRNALNIYFNDSTAYGGNGSYPAGNGTSSLVNALVPKFISSIDPNILYQSAYTNSSACLSNCAFYHLAVPLESDNVVLKSDKDLNDGLINGTVDNCISGTASNPDRCYDITP